MSARHSSDPTIDRICDVLKDARKQVYDILANDEN